MGLGYTKPHLTHEQQLALLVSRGLVSADPEHEVRVLRTAGYYHFSAYVYPFRLLLPDGAKRHTSCHFRSDEIAPGTSFAQVEALWRFDRTLRNTWLEGLHIVEVGVRQQLAYVLGRRDRFGHIHGDALDQAACAEMRGIGIERATTFDLWMRKYERLRDDAKSEDFVRHNIEKYGAGQLPVWIAVEFFDFGSTVRLFSLLKREDRDEIAREFGFVTGKMMRGILLALNTVRNHASHNARLWNRKLAYPVATFKPHMAPSSLAHAAALPARERVYLTLAITAELTQSLDPKANWSSRMRTHLKRFPDIEGMTPSTEMGFPEGWADLPVWKIH